MERASLSCTLFAKSWLDWIAKLAELHNSTKSNHILLGTFPSNSPTTPLFLTPISHFSYVHFPPMFLYLFHSQRCSISLWFHLYSLTWCLLPLTVPAFTCLFVSVHMCVSACVCARNSLLCLHNYIILFSIILYSFFPQAVNIWNLLFFVLFFKDLISSGKRRSRSLSLWFRDSLFRL